MHYYDPPLASPLSPLPCDPLLRIGLQPEVAKGTSRMIRPSSAASSTTRRSPFPVSSAGGSSCRRKKGVPAAHWSEMSLRQGQMPSSVCNYHGYHTPSAALRLVRAQQEAERAAKLLEEVARRVAVTPDPTVDKINLSARAAASTVGEAYKVNAGVAGGSFTPLSADEFSIGAKGRSLFVEWSKKVQESKRQFASTAVWAQTLLGQLQHQCKRLPSPSVYHTLCCCSLLIQTLQDVVPAPARELVFQLLDGVLDGLFCGWRINKSNIEYEEDEEMEAEEEEEVEENRSRSGQIAAACNLTDPADFLRTFSAFFETVEEARKLATVVVEAQHRNEAKLVEEQRKQNDVLLRRADKLQLQFVRCVFFVWRHEARTKRAQRHSARRLIDLMYAQRATAVKRMVFAVLKKNTADMIARRVQTTSDENVRNWRSKESKLLLKVSSLQAELSVERTDHEKVVEGMEEGHEAQVKKILDDTKEMRERATADAERILSLEEQLKSSDTERVAWAKLCNRALREACGINKIGGRDAPQRELLYTTSVAAATPTTSLTPTTTTPTTRAAGQDIQLTPYANLLELVGSPAAANRILLLFCNMVLRRMRPSHPPIQNFSDDLADGEVLLSLLQAAFPQHAQSLKYAFDETPAQRATVICEFLNSVGLESVIAPTDIVLGNVLRNLALVTQLFRMYCSTGRVLHGPLEIAQLMSDDNADPPDISMCQIDVGDENEVWEDEYNAQSNRKQKKTVLKYNFDITSMKKELHYVFRDNRSWEFLSEVVQRDLTKKLQNIRSQFGEVLDEKQRKFMEWFVAVDEQRCSPLIAAVSSNARNEVDKIVTVLEGAFWELKATYLWYSVGEGGGAVMAQSALNKLVKEAQLTKGLARSAMDEAFAFAAATEEITEPVFLPTAVGAARRNITPQMAAIIITPYIFIHVLIHLAHQRLLVTLATPTASAAATTGSSCTLHDSLRTMLSEQMAGQCSSSNADALHSQSRHPFVQQQYKRHQKQLQKLFLTFCSSTQQLQQQGGGKKGGSTASKTQQAPTTSSSSTSSAALMSAEELVHLTREMKLLDSKLSAEDVGMIHKFITLTSDEELRMAATAGGHKGGGPNAVGMSFAGFIDALTAIAMVKYPTPIQPPYNKVQQLLKEGIAPRFKEVLK